MAKQLPDVTDFLRREFASAPQYRDLLIGLWEDFRSLGLAKYDFVVEFTSGKKERFFQRLWEMLLARHLASQGYTVTSARTGPDFRFELEPASKG